MILLLLWLITACGQKLLRFIESPEYIKKKIKLKKDVEHTAFQVELYSEILIAFLHAAPHSLSLNPLVAASLSVIEWKNCVTSRLLSYKMSSQSYYFCTLFPKHLPGHMQFIIQSATLATSKLISFH